ncbi:MAG: flagellin lysine-N-methylase [Clostridia bacterium]|nr:flagellin lysine-N-methylase [Clostridia bacterium]
MELFAPTYYPTFQCIAHRCRHSCCVGWEIDIDDDTLARYQGLSGEMGQRIRQSIQQGEDGARFALGEGERCPHLDDRGLCRIITHLGEGYLCDICREHPRFYNVVGDRMECGLGASCEEAARLILQTADYTTLVCISKDENDEKRETVCDFDVISQRNALFSVLANGAISYDERRMRVAQCVGAATLADGATRTLLNGLEYLNDHHRVLLAETFAAGGTPLELAPLCERFLAYLIYRHTGAETTAQGFGLAVGLALLLERCFYHLMLRHGIAPVEAARIVSEELEYSTDNTDAIRFALELQGL